MSKQLTADDILGADDRQLQKIEIEEWGGHVFIRTMSGKERDAWEASMVSITKRRVGGRLIEEAQADPVNIRAKLVVQVACDEAGNPLFTPAQVVELGEKSGAALDRIFEAAKASNHLSNADIEELEKNS